MNQIAGTPSLGAEYPVQNIVSVPLTNQSLTVPELEQYSYIYQGNAQILDHCLTTDLQGLTFDKLQYVRANADNPKSFVDVLFPNFRTSDHDGFVLFLELGSDIGTNVNEILENNFSVKYPNPFFQNQTITLYLKQSDYINFELINVEGKIVFEKNLGKLSASNNFLTIPLQFPIGQYFLKIKGEKDSFVGKIIIQNL